MRADFERSRQRRIERAREDLRRALGSSDEREAWEYALAVESETFEEDVAEHEYEQWKGRRYDVDDGPGLFDEYGEPWFYGNGTGKLEVRTP